MNEQDIYAYIFYIMFGSLLIICLRRLLFTSPVEVDKKIPKEHQIYANDYHNYLKSYYSQWQMYTPAGERKRYYQQGFYLQYRQ